MHNPSKQDDKTQLNNDSNTLDISNVISNEGASDIKNASETDSLRDKATNETKANAENLTPAYATASPSLKKRPKLVANRGFALFWYIISLVVVAIDQWTKWLAETQLVKGESISVIEPYLDWTLAYNKGAAFSLLANQPGWQKWFFAILSLVMSVLLIIYLLRAPRRAKALNIGLALILGGAIGNLIDRVRIGKVVDFIHVHYANVWHYPIFNIADIAICTGVAIVIFDMLFLESKRTAKYQG